MFRKPLFAILFMIGITATGILAQQDMKASFAPSNEEAAKQVDAFLSQWDKNDMPGCSVGAIRDGELVYKRAFGMANLEHDVPNTTTTRFNVASVSKAFTGASIALLAQQGKLSLDDDIRKFVPEIPQYSDTVKIRHLLHHTSGIREYQALVLFGGLGPDNAYDDKAILKMLGRQKNLSFKPGSKYQYSNSNFHLLGVIVGRVSGKPLRAFADENIFKPLGMKNTLFADNRFEVIKNRAQGYQFGPDKSIRARSSLFDLVGGGGILTTVEDLYLWDQNFHDPKVGGKEMVTMVTTPGTLNNGKKVNYGFGLFHNPYKGLPVIKHSGNMGGYRAQIATFPGQRFTAIALCNNMAIIPQQIVEKLADIYLEGQLKPTASGQKAPSPALPPTTAISEKDAARYAGIYAHLESGRTLKLSLKEGKLVESAIFRKDVPVMAASDDRLIVADGNGSVELNPVFHKTGAVSEIRIMTEDGTPDVWVPVKPPVEGPERLSEYAGTYHSDELDADYAITLKGKNLVVQISDSLQPTLTPSFADSFFTANGEINFSFVRDEKGKISGFVFNSGADGRDVKGVAFKRL